MAILLCAVLISKVYFVFTTRQPTRMREWLPSEFCMRLSFRGELHSAQIGTIQQISRCTDECPPVIQTLAPMLSLFWTVTVRAPTSRTSGRILPELDPRPYLRFIDAASVDVPRVQVLLQAENSWILSYSLQPLRRAQRTHGTLKG